MNSFYEKYRDDAGKLLVIQDRKEVFPAHFHSNMEICFVQNGVHPVKINEREYTLTAGCIAVMDSYDIHSYLAPTATGKACAVMIPYSYLRRFNAKRKAKKIACPVILDEALCEKLLRIVEEYLSPAQNAESEKAAIELLLALLGERLEYVESKSGDERDLVRKILVFLQENYRADVSRSTIAKALGYTQSHISKVFHRYLNTGISEYVNRLRMEYIESLKQAGDERTTTELIYEAGFKSQQTYYRVKKNLS